MRHITGVSAASTITVDSATDDGTGCTLREAIQSSNTDTAVGGCTAGSGAGDTIEFDIAGAGPHTISPTSLLPDITQSVIIDGYTETGAVANTNPAPQALNGTLMIVVDLSGAGSGTITITGPDVTIRGLVVNGATGSAFSLHTSSNNAVFEGNYIGTTVSGLAADANGGHGIVSQVLATTVGGTDPADRNLISGNGARGVQIQADAADNGVIQGNLIGTDATGNAAIANGTGGIMVVGGDNTQIGGTTSGAQNVISGNTLGGLSLIESSVNNTVRGNYIGLGSDGSTDVGNAGPGLVIGGSGNTVGGATSSARNVISGNSDSGVSLGAADSNTIQGNYVGLNVAGTATVSNDGRGIYVYQSDDNLIGGDASGEGNVIAGNSEGVSLEESDNNTVSGNYIGLNAAGDADLGNTNWGIRIFNDSDSNVVGGDTAAERNVISGNGDDGILVTDATTNANQIIGNYIGTDSTGAVDIGNGSDGISVLNGTDNTTIGSGTSGHGNVISGNGDNGVVVSSAGTTGTIIQGNTIGLSAAGTADLGNDDNGIAVNSLAPAVTIGGTTSGEGNVISGNAIDGILISSTTASSSTIQGNIIGLSAAGTADLGNSNDGVEIASGSNTVGGNTSTARNVISGNDNDGIFLTGTSATLNTISGNYIGTNSAGTADLGNTDDGIEIGGGAASNTIGGDTSAERNIISGNNEHGIVIGNAAASSNIIRANYIGTSADGSADLGNSANGIVTFNSAPAITIGGATSGMGNVISGNGLNGIVLGSTSTNSTIQGNIIGLDAGGTLDRGNDDDGIESSAPSTTIGGSTSASRNIISGNDDYGVNLISTATASTIQGNYIGTNATGTAAVGNTLDGVFTNASGVEVGGVDSGQRNVISGNGLDGIGTHSSVTSITIRGNYIGTSADGMSDLGNTGDGIDGFNMTVGGTTSGSRNVISGNTGRGVAATGGSTIQGNYIGLNVAGTAALPNGSVSSAAVNIAGNNNTLGGTTAAARNVISGNSTAVGVTIVGLTAFGGGSSSNNVVQGNYIGTNTNGEVQSGFGNDLGMVILLDSLNSLVGGTTAGAGNIIAGNGAGIACFGISGAGLLPLNNSFLGNSIYSNSGGSLQGLGLNLGIDLFDNPTGDFTTFVNVGVNANDAGDPDTPANRYINYPVISSVASDNGQATVTYSLDINDAEVGATGYRVEFFANDSPDASGNGQGQTYLGATTVTGDVTNAVANLTLPAGVSGAKYISAVTTMTDNSTDGFGHSSEFSANLLATLEAATGGSGGGSSGTINLADTGIKALLVVAIAVTSVTTGLYILLRRKVYISGK